MSTKTIAVESTVHARLAREKRESESFTKVIARLLNVAAESHTAGSIVAAVTSLKPLSNDDAERMLAVVREDRADEDWSNNDLR